MRTWTTVTDAVAGPAHDVPCRPHDGPAFAGLVIGIFITGPLVDRHGAKVFTLGGLGLITLSLAALAFAPDYTTLGVALFVLGLGSGVGDMVLSPVVAALNPGDRSAAMNWLHSFYCVGTVVTVLVGTPVLEIG